MRSGGFGHGRGSATRTAPTSGASRTSGANVATAVATKAALPVRSSSSDDAPSSNATWRGDVAGVQAEAEELLARNTELRRALGKLRQTVMLEARTRMAQLKSILKEIKLVQDQRALTYHVDDRHLPSPPPELKEIAALTARRRPDVDAKEEELVVRAQVGGCEAVCVWVLAYAEDRHLPSLPAELREIAALTARRRLDVDAKEEELVARVQTKEEELVARAQVRVLSLREEIERAVHADLRLSFSRCAASLQHTQEAQQAHTQAMQAYMAAHATLALRLMALSVLKQPGSAEKLQQLREQPNLLFSPAARNAFLSSLDAPAEASLWADLLFSQKHHSEASLWSDLLFSASHFPSIFLSTDHHPSRISSMQSLVNAQNGTVLARKLRTDHAAAAVKEAKGKLPELCHVSASWVSPEGADVSPCTLANRISEEARGGKNGTSMDSRETEGGAGMEKSNERKGEASKVEAAAVAGGDGGAKDSEHTRDSGPLSEPLAPSALWRQPLWDLSFPTHPSAFPTFPHSYAFKSPASSPFSSSLSSPFSSLLSSASLLEATSGESITGQSSTAATDAATGDAHTHSQSAKSPGSSSASSSTESATSSPATSAAAVNISFLIYTSPPTTAALDLVSKLYECTHGRLRAGSIGGRLGGLTSEAIVLLDGPSIPLHHASAMVHRGKTAGAGGSGSGDNSSSSSSSSNSSSSSKGIPGTVPGFEKYYNPADWIQATRRTSPGSFLTHILAPSRMGAARAYNLLSLLARGSILILLAGGDLPPDSCDWAANLVVPFSAWPRLGIAGHSMGKMGLRNVPGSLQLGEVRSAGDQFWNRLRDPVTGVRMSFVLGTVTGPMAARRDVFVKVGGFSAVDGGIDALSDWDLCQHVWLSGHQVALVYQEPELRFKATDEVTRSRSDSIPQDASADRFASPGGFRRQRHDSIGGGIPGAGGMRQMLTPGSAAAAAARQRRMSVQFASGFSKPTGLQLPGSVGQGGPMTPTAGGNTTTTATKKVQKSMMMCMDPTCNACPPEMHALRNKKLMAQGHRMIVRFCRITCFTYTSKLHPNFPPKRKKRKSRWTKAWEDVQDFFQPVSMLWQPWGILNPHSKFMARWNKVFMVASILGFTIDPWFLFTLQALNQVAPQPHIPSFTAYVESTQTILLHPVPTCHRQAMLCLTLDWAAAITFTAFCGHAVPHSGLDGSHHLHCFLWFSKATSKHHQAIIKPSLPTLSSPRQAMLCLTLDWTAAITFTVLRSFVDLCYVIQIVVQFRMAYIVPPPTNRKNRFFRRWWADRSLQSPGDLEFDARVIASRYLRSWFLIDVLAALPIPQSPGDLEFDARVIARRYLRSWFLIDVLAALPIPQIVMLVIVPMMGRSVPSNTGVAMTVLCLAALFAQNVPRAIRFFPILSGNGPHVTGLVFETAWANFLINFVFYLMASYIPEYMYCVDQNAIAYQIAASPRLSFLPTYIPSPLSLQRFTTCMAGQCATQGDACQPEYMYCVDQNAIAYQNTAAEAAWAAGPASACLVLDNPSSDALPSPIDYGIFTNAVPLVVEGAFLSKDIYSFWGFQQVSTLAGNLEPSRWDPEVLFVILVIGLGLVLLALLIGNISNFLQALSRRSFEYQLQRHDIDSWMERRNLPLSLQKRVQKQQRLHWVATRGVEEAEVLDKLSDDIQTDVRRSLCLELLQCCVSVSAGVRGGGVEEAEVRRSLCLELLQCVSAVVWMGDSYASAVSALFFAMEPQVLDAFCEKLRQQLYIEGTVILKEGYPVSRLFFVLRGQLESYTTIGGRAGFVDSVLLGKGDFLGEELLVEYLEKLSDGNKSRRSGTQIRYLGRWEELLVEYFEKLSDRDKSRRPGTQIRYLGRLVPSRFVDSVLLGKGDFLGEELLVEYLEKLSDGNKSRRSGTQIRYLGRCRLGFVDSVLLGKGDFLGEELLVEYLEKLSDGNKSRRSGTQIRYLNQWWVGFVDSVLLGKGDFLGEELLVEYLEKLSDGNKSRRLSGTTIRYLGRSVTMGASASASAAALGTLAIDVLPTAQRTVRCIGPVEGYELEATDVAVVCRQFARMLATSKIQAALNSCLPPPFRSPVSLPAPSPPQ
ncbi:unnamed protein product [Closterium sp. Naga37s-1]|nr:unnamed protein product [Closterium sp. Naga37s-1]